MINIKEKKNCSGCHACYNVCPSKCIKMIEDNEGFLYPKIDKSFCLDCGLCEKVCPFNKNEPVRKKKPTVYASFNIENEKRNSSSSGGVFVAIAEYILNNDGVVYGAAFESDFKNVVHIRIDNKNDCYKIQKSKYIQSIIGNTFSYVLNDLKNNKLVLFSGTPCQISGLRLFLQKKYENLYLVEVVCHGVPSKKVWNSYYSFYERKYKAHLIGADFRKKMDQTNTFGTRKTKECVSVFIDRKEDIYIQSFVNNYCLRESCYNCVPKKLESMADLTLGDFWGIEKISPHLCDHKGTSIVFANTEAGEELLKKLKLHLEITDYEKCVKHNPSYNFSSKRPGERDTFIIDLEKETLLKVFSNSKKVKFSVKIKKVIKRFIRRKEEKENLTYGLYLNLKKEKK